ncbi:MAG: DNRLRE domain-containing protein, partial [Anaerolineae bacterium]
AALFLLPLPATQADFPRHQAISLDIPGTIRILPAVAATNVGGSVTVEVWLENVGNYYGIDLRLAFDPAVVRVPSSQVTPLWDVFDPVNHFTIKNEANNGTGFIWYALTNINPAEAFTGTGRVCSITFQGVADGATALHFTYVKGSTRDGSALYPTMVDGTIVVGAGGPTRTPTRTPTATSTTVATLTSTPTSTTTATRTPTRTATATGTVTAVGTSTATPTATRTSTYTATPTATSGATRTATPTSQFTLTRTPTHTPLVRPTNAPTWTKTSTPTPTTVPTAIPYDTVVTLQFQREVLPHSLYTGVLDTYIDSDYPAENYGQDWLLRFNYDGRKKVLIRFDLANEIPSDAVVIAASLQFYFHYWKYPLVATKTGLYQVLRPWAEKEATWGSPWHNGCDALGLDRAAEPVAIAWMDSPGWQTWASAELAALVQNWIRDPATNYGLVLVGLSVDDRQFWVGFSSQFGGTQEHKMLRPKLSVTFYRVQPTDTPTPTATCTATPTPTPLPTHTATMTNTPTAMPTPTCSATPTDTPTATSTSTATTIPTPTFTRTATVTATPTRTTTPTATRTSSPTHTATFTPTAMPQRRCFIPIIYGR